MHLKQVAKNLKLDQSAWLYFFLQPRPASGMQVGSRPRFNPNQQAWGFCKVGTEELTMYPRRVIKILTIEFKLGKKYSEGMKEMKENKKV